MRLNNEKGQGGHAHNTTRGSVQHDRTPKMCVFIPNTYSCTRARDSSAAGAGREARV